MGREKDQVELVWLDQYKIEKEITKVTLASISNIDILPTIASTNFYLSNQPVVNNKIAICFAEEQTQGRGRQGKDWYSPKACNIYSSFGFPMDAPLNNNVSALSLAVGVILLDVLQRYENQSRPYQLKWPNDLYFANRKLAGILIEIVKITHIHCRLIIGIGINVCMPKDNPIASSIDLTEVCGGQVIDRNKLAGILIDEIVLQVPRYFTHGFSPFIDKWREHDILQNKFLVVRQANYEIPGIAQGINENGELLLRDAKGKEYTFCYGDVSVSLDASAGGRK